MNPFESGSRKVIPAVLVYLWRRVAGGGREFLMIHRQGREGDFHSGKWNGLGGKLEADESPWQAAAREVQEEAGLRLSFERFQWRGMLQFPNFKPHKAEDWWCAVLFAELDSAVESVAEGARFSEEGTLHWIREERLLDLNLWEGDRSFLPGFLSDRHVFGTIRYIDGRVSEARLEYEATRGEQ